MPKGYWVEDRYPAEVKIDEFKGTVKVHYGNEPDRGLIIAEGGILDGIITSWQVPGTEGGKKIIVESPCDELYGKPLTDYLSFH